MDPIKCIGHVHFEKKGVERNEQERDRQADRQAKETQTCTEEVRPQWKSGKVL